MLRHRDQSLKATRLPGDLQHLDTSCLAPYHEAPIEASRVGRSIIMAIAFSCTQCGKQFNVDASLAGKRIKCKACGAGLTIPASEPTEVEDPFGLDDAEDSPSVLPRSPRGGRQPARSPGVPAWVWFAGGGIGLLVVVLIGATLLSRPGAPPNVAQSPPDKPGNSEETQVPAEAPDPADLARFKRDKASAAPAKVAEGAWRVKPDPSPESVEFPPIEKLSITVPKAFAGERILYPTTPSPFVMLGGNDADDQYREVWDLRAAKSVGRLSGRIEAAKPMALSPDGAYFVTHTNPVPRTTDVWSVAEAKRVARIEDGKDIPDFVDFAGPGRIVIGTTYAKTLQVWDFLEGKPVAKITTPDNFKADSIAFSPGRHSMALALAQKNKLLIYDLKTGRLEGEIALEKVDSSNFDCDGLAFSPDGTALAGLFTLGGETHLTSWDATTGKLVSDFPTPGHNVYGKSFSYKAPALQWLPDQSGWLIQDQTFVERQSGQIVWSMPFPAIKYSEHGPRKVLDLGRIVTLSDVNGQQVIKLAALPKDKIQTAIALARGGKNAIDAILPTVARPDLAGAKKVATASGPVAWSYAPGALTPAKGSAPKAIPVKVPAGDVLSLVVSSPDAAQALVVSSPGGRLSGVKGKQTQDARQVGRFDLVGGRSLDKFEIPSVSTPIAFSPGGTHFLLSHTAGFDRLDLHSADGGKHLVGWRPYDQETGDDRNVAWADFLDAKRVLTVNPAGTLILWSVPDAKAIYVASKAMQGLPALAPDRKTLAVLRGGTLRLLDPSTGEPQGDASSSGHQGTTGLGASGFSPDGLELAAVLDGTIVRWDLKTGQIVGEVASPSPKAAMLQYGGARHVLLDGKVLFNLESGRTVWHYDGSVHAIGGSGPLHQYVASEQIIGPGTLRTLDLPDKKVTLAETAFADPKTKALLREGLKVSIQVVGEPAREPEKFRRELVEGLTDQLKQVGVEATDGQPVKLVVKFNVKDSANNIEFRKFTGKGDPEKRILRARLFDWELSVADDKGAPIVIARDTVPYTSPGFMEHIPDGENDWEGYLKARQFLNGAAAVLKYGVPYYVARRPEGGVFLPGRTFLGHPTL
jgi:WD40 repeat protein